MELLSFSVRNMVCHLCKFRQKSPFIRPTAAGNKLGLQIRFNEISKTGSRRRAGALSMGAGAPFSGLGAPFGQKLQLQSKSNCKLQFLFPATFRPRMTQKRKKDSIKTYKTRVRMRQKRIISIPPDLDLCLSSNKFKIK